VIGLNNIGEVGGMASGNYRLYLLREEASWILCFCYADVLITKGREFEKKELTLAKGNLTSGCILPESLGYITLSK